jgi:hypothetical protein
MLWRAAPLRLLRAPGWLLLVLGAATLFVASVVAPPLFAATARSTALADALAASSGTPYGPSSGDVRITWDQILTPEAEAVVRERLDALTGYGDAVVTGSGVAQSRTLSALAVANGRQAESELWYHDGAITALGGDEDAPGVWLAQDVADELGVEVGDPVRVGMVQTFFGRHKSLSKSVLAGTYETAPGSALPTALAGDPDAGRWFLPPDPYDPSSATPLAIAGRAEFDRMLGEAGETPLYLADLRLDPDISPDDAARAVEDIQVLADDAFDGSTPLGQVLINLEPLPAELQVITGLPDIVFAADYAATSARDQVTPYGVAGQVLAAALLVAAWVLLGRTRRREQLLATGLGLRPLEVAGQGGLEALPIALVALPAGLALAVLGVLTAGPPTDSGIEITQDDVVRAALAAGAGLLLIAITAGLAAAATDRMDRVSRLGRSRRVVPLTAALVVATAAVAVAVFTTDVVDRSSTVVTMAFPVLVAATVAVLVARSVSWLRGRLPGRARPGSARWLATRRTGPVVREVTALSAVIAIALGLFGYALTAHRGIEEGVADKTAAVAGAATVIEVAEDFRAGGMKRAVTPPADGTSIVWRRGVALPPDYGNQPLMAIDPESFDAVADWGATGELEEARAAAGRLDEKAKGLAVVLAGDTDAKVGDQGVLDFSSEFQIPIRVVGVAAAFPGSETETGNVTVITSARRLFRLVAPTVDPRRKKANSGEAGAFTSQVWSDDTAAGLRRTLDLAGVSTDGEVSTSTQAAIAAGLTASTWAAGYVLALGVVMLVLALGGALVLALRLADRDATSDVLLARMGLRPPELARSRAWEVAYAVVTALLAALAAGAVLVATPTIIDATAALPPLARPRADLLDVGVLALAVVAMVLVAWLVGAQRAGRRHPAEVLRGGG